MPEVLDPLPFALADPPDDVLIVVFSRSLNVEDRFESITTLLPTTPMTYVSCGWGIGGRGDVERPQVDHGVTDRHHQGIAEQHLGAVLVQQGDVLRHGAVGRISASALAGPIVPGGVWYT